MQFLKRFCSDPERTWYKLESYSETFGDINNVDQQCSDLLREYLTDELQFSPKMAELLMKNSCETNWPTGFKTDELREKNEEMIKQLKGKLFKKKVWLSIFYFNNFFLNLKEVYDWI